MKKRILSIVLILLSLIIFCHTPAEASLLRLYAEPSIYIDKDSDAWLRESWLVGSDDFALQVLNDYKEKKDPFINTILNTYLVIAIKEETKDAGITINLNGDTIDADDFINSGKHSSIKKHGVFGKHTYYYDYFIGDLSPQEIYDIDVEIQAADMSLVHFDAYGDLVRKGKGCGKEDEYATKRITNPYSHDVTWEGNPIPEPATMLLLGSGIVGLFGLKKKRQF